MSTSEYQKRIENEKVFFDVKPASCPKNKSALYIAIPIILIMLVVFFPIAIVAALAVWYLGFHKDWRPAAHRVPSAFFVTSAAIESNGRVFKKEDIHRLLIKNGISKTEMAQAFIASGAPGSGAFAVGQQYKAKIAAVANSLDVETGGNAYSLAGGMSETTAFGLMTDVGRVLGI